MESHDTEPEAMDTEESNNHNLDTNENNMQFIKKVERNREKQRENFVTSGNLFIIVFMNLLKGAKFRKEVVRHYMERVLHSIFFFGHIHCPPIAPEEFLPETLTERYKEAFPKPFKQYNTHLPRYTPYSILLEYMTKGMEWDDLDLLSKHLENVNKSLLKSHKEKEDEFIANDFAFNASAVTFCCVKDSNNAKVLRKAYGSSLSCKGKIERKIMIAVSALHVWDRAVSYAVCCAGQGHPITFPERVECMTYSFIQRKKIPPCNKCFKMYKLKAIPEHEAHNKMEHWPYGNCAENESLSRLLQCDEDVRREICIIDENGRKVMNRQDIENKFKEEYEDEIKRTARNNLTPRKVTLPLGEWNFFSPD
ncbi:uncharacterized protein LOC130297561 [Hyla sarda]|uniref:uncharacterized protein LOC130297561 n=1 Tax=Hyla sarda TaxID=327740 RepID=UPI0024C27F1F|nr:uncharacterized protein LOC130297561 [Hyla sarda]